MHSVVLYFGVGYGFKLFQYQLSLGQTPEAVRQQLTNNQYSMLSLDRAVTLLGV